jgi:hypothetical protein
MTTETINEFAASLVLVEGYRNGGPGRRETFRISWSVDGQVVDLRTTKGRRMSARGLCDAWNVQGAGQRETARARAARECAEALACIADAHTGLAGLVQL